MSQTIYLIGQIDAAAPESYAWRKIVREYFAEKNDNGLNSSAEITERSSLMPSLDPFATESMELPMIVLSMPEESTWKIIDPCHNKFNEGVRTDFTTREKVYETAGVDLIVPKNRMAVQRSSMCFANLHRYDPEKALIGTMFELAWYADSPDKAVIGIFDGDHTKDEYCRHPFVRNSVHMWVNTAEEACEIAERYFTD
jgi:hypothetical protein